jgi:hypothetical protein
MRSWIRRTPRRLDGGARDRTHRAIAKLCTAERRGRGGQKRGAIIILRRELHLDAAEPA